MLKCESMKKLTYSKKSMLTSKISVANFNRRINSNLKEIKTVKKAKDLDLNRVKFL